MKSLMDFLMESSIKILEKSLAKFLVEFLSDFMVRSLVDSMEEFGKTGLSKIAGEIPGVNVEEISLILEN